MVTPSSVISSSVAPSSVGGTNTLYNDYVVLVEADQEFNDDDAELMEAIHSKF